MSATLFREPGGLRRLLPDVRVLPRPFRVLATGRLGAVDFSFDRFNSLGDYKAAYASGCRGFLSYTSPSSGKDFTAREIEWIHSLGSDAWVLTLWEQYASDPLGGYSVGQRHAAGWRSALGALQRGVGYSQKNKPAGDFAFDQDFGTAQYPALESYCHGVRSELGSSAWLMGYGKHALLKYFRDSGFIDKRHLTYAWLYGFLPGASDAEIYQYLNGQARWSATVDYNQVNADPTSFGAWFRPGSPHDVAPGVPPKPGQPYLRRRWPSYMGPNDYFGDEAGPAESRGGYNDYEHPDILAIKARLWAIGYRSMIPTDPHIKQGTVDAITTWGRHHNRPGAEQGRIYEPAWNALFTY